MSSWQNAPLLLRKALTLCLLKGTPAPRPSVLPLSSFLALRWGSCSTVHSAPLCCWPQAQNDGAVGHKWTHQSCEPSTPFSSKAGEVRCLLQWWDPTVRVLIRFEQFSFIFHPPACLYLHCISCKHHVVFCFTQPYLLIGILFDSVFVFLLR